MNDSDSEDEGISAAVIPQLTRTERKRRSLVLKSILENKKRVKQSIDVANVLVENESAIEAKQSEATKELHDRSAPLIDIAEKLKLKKEDPIALAQKKLEEEEELLRTVTASKNDALHSKSEAATGARFEDVLTTGWKPSNKIRIIGSEEVNYIRNKYNLLVEGENVPPPVKKFKQMNLPRCILQGLKAKNITRPTPIQVQALPAALSGRDLIGVASTGSGKTVTFAIPLIILALGQEINLSIQGEEGPIGVVLGPSRELQRQTFDVVNHFLDFVNKDLDKLERSLNLKRRSIGKLRATLIIGGENINDRLYSYKRKGTHIIIATPGRLIDLLKKRQINLLSCRFLCLDEGDRMTEEPFDGEVQQVLDFFNPEIQRQTLLFSATMPRKCIDFARKALVQPIIVQANRAGAANLNVTQHVHSIKQEAKMSFLLENLQKTSPPVLIFCEKQREVDEITEYLLFKGVEACSVHGGKDQTERNRAVAEFRAGDKDVLVATDVAAKGLDFPLIQHVINFDVPKEIENYVHRIGRTGRSGKKGLATTFVDGSVDPSFLVEMKHLLLEAKQTLPEFLKEVGAEEEGDSEKYGKKASLSVMQKLLKSGGGARSTTSGSGCGFCGGLGHSISSCPRLKSNIRSQRAGMRDVVKGGGSW